MVAVPGGMRLPVYQGGALQCLLLLLLLLVGFNLLSLSLSRVAVAAVGCGSGAVLGRVQPRAAQNRGRELKGARGLSRSR